MGYNIDKALNLIKLERYDEAISYVKKAVSDKEEDSFSTLALMYIKGMGVDKSMDKAFDILNQGMSNNDKYAYSMLADIYYKGEVVDQDIEKAKNLYLKALSLGDTHSIGMLGLINYDRKRYDEAVKYLKDGVAINDINSIYYLGLCALNGYGMEVDLKLAFLSFESCYKQMPNKLIFAEQLGNMYFDGLGVEQNFKNAFELYNPIDNDNANYKKALMYKNGLFVKKDNAKAYDLFKKVKTPEAQLEAGLIEYLGLGIDVNKEAAYLKFFAAANSKCSEAYPLLGDCYLNGEGIKKDINEAIKWYTKAYKANIPNQMINIGTAYIKLKKYEQAIQAFTKEEDGVLKFAALGSTYVLMKNYDLAIPYLEKACHLNDVNSTYLLYKLYSKKLGKKKNKDTASLYYKKYLMLVNKIDK